MKQSVTIGIIAAVVIVLGIAGMVYMQQKGDKQATTNTTPTAVVGEEQKNPSIQEEAEGQPSTTPATVQPTTPSLTAPGPGDAATRTITTEELAKHNTEADCWLAVEGKVYAIPTPVQQGHPGSAPAIINNCGKDATKGFQTKGGKGDHSAQARDFLKTLVIGTLQN